VRNYSCCTRQILWQLSQHVASAFRLQAVSVDVLVVVVVLVVVAVVVAVVAAIANRKSV